MSRHLTRRGPVDRGRVVLAVGVVLVLAATAWRAWGLSHTWFHLDDLVLVDTAMSHPLTLGSLLTPYFSHVMPAGRLLAWAITQVDPLDYAFAAAQLVVFYLAAGLGLLRLLVTLFGRRPGVLVPLVYFLASPILVPATTWWSAGINHLPALVATIFALDAHVRYLRGHRVRHLLASLLWLGFGLLFAELTLLAYLPMALVSLGYFATGPTLDRVLLLWQRHRGAVLAHAALVVGYLAAYLTVNATAASAPLPTADQIPWGTFVNNTLGVAFPSAAIGGPGTWHLRWAAQIEVDPAVLTRLLGLAVVGTVLALSAATRHRSLRAWLIPASQLLATALLVGQSRSLFGPGIALDLRFMTPVALGTALALGLAFLPILDADESAEPIAAHWFVDRAAPVTVVLAGFVAFSAVSAAAFPLVNLGERSPRTFYRTVATTLAEQSGPVDLVDAAVPPWVLGFIEGAYSKTLIPFADKIRFPTVVQDDYFVFDDQGHLARPGLKPVRRSVFPVPDPGCGYRISAPRGSVPLDGPVTGYGWRLRLEYDASVSTEGTISLGNTDTDVQFLAGEHTLEMPANATYDSVDISGLEPGSTVCVGVARIGTLTMPD